MRVEGVSRLSHLNDVSGTSTAKKKVRDREAHRTVLQLASLNINGYGNLLRDHPDNKWGKIYRMMTEHRIGVLLLQETHLTRERVAAIHQMFAKKIKVFFSECPDAPTQREGVAVVLNARYVDTAKARATVLVPGRALQVAVSCQGGDVKHILCVYAPTSSGVAARRTFFEDVRRFYEANPTCQKPNLMAGDFNTVEDAIDRLPVGDGPDSSMTTLDDLKVSLGLMMADGWRVTYPNLREYTFHRGSGRDAVFSRLDRIYMSHTEFDKAREWVICEAGVRTDHSLVMVQLTPDNAPLMGQGRPLFPLKLLKDRVLTRRIKARGLEAGRELDRLMALEARSGSDNPQRILHRFKVAAMKIARDREREVVPKLLWEIRERETALRKVKADVRMTEQTKMAEAEALTKQVRQLKQRRYKQQQQDSRATHRLYGDRPTKYWSRLHRECAPREVIHAFKKEGITGVAGEKLYETDSVRMAEMAKIHHMNVQRDDPDMRTAEERDEDVRAALDSLDARLSATQAEEMEGEITYQECLLSLRFAKNGTAPGLDGIPFEFWKTLNARYVEDSRFHERDKFDVIKLLTAAFEDARVHGVDASTSLAHGWIAPIYKEKGERTRVVNYRPITLLNTYYKLLSKTLAVRLASVAPCIVHKAQAGFVPGRRIHNHTQLARMMMLWAEENDADGAIVALDQEKAYDRIAHDYLWKVLARFGFPVTFIRLVQSLYKNAVTSVMVNGILSGAYRVYRGVRQGDPLSCLLFDLAIEPLSAMIRKSAIEGFNIPRCHEVLKAVLFADDTTVYLSSRDDFSLLQKVLDTWCSAAKARFNISKTEIIPIGSVAHRERMAETYRATGSWGNYPRGVHVAQNGEAVRILGAYFGNGINQVGVWSLVLTKIMAMRQPLMKVMARWRAGHASIQGRRHVAQMIVGGTTQFLTMVQRMPNAIVMRLNKVIRGYLWDDRVNTPVGMKHVYLPVSKGGLGMIDLEARNEAIDVMWLKMYLDFGEDRPMWAFLVDDLLATYVCKDCNPRQKAQQRNPFLQRWKPRINGLPEALKGITAVARKYKLRLEGLAFSRAILRAMPMWDHVYADAARIGRLSMPSKLLTCLQQAHGAMTVGDFEDLAGTLDCRGHQPRASCSCESCKNLRDVKGCANPHLCSIRARDLIGTLLGKWNPTGEHPEDYERAIMSDLSKDNLAEDLVPFDRSITTYGNIGKIFTDDEPVSNASMETMLEEDGDVMIIASDGSCVHNGEKRARAGAGIYVEGRPDLCRSVRLPDELEQTNQTGEVVAAYLAFRTAGEKTRMVLETDSQTTKHALTIWTPQHEDTGYLLQKNADMTRAVIAQLRKRKAHTLLKWVRGHAGHVRNEAADKLAAAGAERLIGDQLSLDTPAEYRISGVKLQAMTQKLVYRAIRAKKDAMTNPRPRAVANMDRITSGVQAAFGAQIYDETIWLSLRSKHISRQASQFMWMAIHDGYMIGSHWLRPKMGIELQARAMCAICGECETMTHIILECNAVGQELLWGLLQRTWNLTKASWYTPSWGTAFGAACAIFESGTGSRQTALEQLWCILCTETLHLIWKIRCERVIQREGEEFTVNEITNRFYAAMDSRLDLDRRTAAKARGKRALKPRDVERIWGPVIDDRQNLPQKWVKNSGVLVGIKGGGGEEEQWPVHGSSSPPAFRVPHTVRKCISSRWT